MWAMPPPWSFRWRGGISLWLLEASRLAGQSAFRGASPAETTPS